MSTQREQSTARPGGLRRSLVGLLWSLVPVLIVIVLLVLWQRGSASPVQSIDPTPDVTYAKRVSPVPLPAPGPLPGTWRATSSHVDAPAGEKRSPVTLTIGYLTENDRFAEVVIGDRPVASLLTDTVPQATPDGNSQVGPAGWDVYRSKRGEQVLASTVGEAGVVVTGDASGADLAALAAAVR